MPTLYTHWRDAPRTPEAGWRWPHFKPEELASRSDGELLVDEDALDKLETLRGFLGAPIILTSAYRSPAHNKKIGGAKNSYHMKGRAFDVDMANHDPVSFVLKALTAGFRGTIRYPRSARPFIHIDTREERYDAGDPFPPRAHRFDQEEPRAPRETLAGSRTMKGAAATTLAGAGATVADVIEAAGGVAESGAGEAAGALLDAQAMLEPLVPYAATMKWAFLAVAFGGVCLTVWARLDDWRKGRR